MVLLLFHDKQSVLLKAARGLGTENHADPAHVCSHASEQVATVGQAGYNGRHTADLNQVSFACTGQDIPHQQAYLYLIQLYETKQDSTARYHC